MSNIQEPRSDPINFVSLSLGWLFTLQTLMSEYSEITISDPPACSLKSSHYSLVFRLQLRDSEIGHCSHAFRYSYDEDRSLVFYIELDDPAGSIVVRLGTDEGDTKSYDMFQLFLGIKSEASQEGWAHRLRFQKKLFSGDWDNFEGFYPFGMTLIQPPLSSLSSMGSGDFVYVAHAPTSPHLLSLRIYRRRFRGLRVFKDVTGRDVVYERHFEQKHAD
jgi:hypothetical protein